METNPNIYREPKYTLRWLGIQSVCVLLGALVLAFVASAIDGFAAGRVNDGIYQGARYALLTQAVPYCFAVISITGFTLMLAEIAFRKTVNYLQYALIALAQTLFYLLLLAISEKLSFAISYTIVSVMTVGLIGWFIGAITRIHKAIALTAGILVGEYALMFVLIQFGAMALLIGSFSLFLLIALAMYFTLKLKVENEELTIKR